jgi:hypothetical protein
MPRHKVATASITILAVAWLAGSATAHVSGRPDHGAANRPAAANVSLEPVGQFGGAVNAVAVADGLTYVGVGPRLVVYDFSVKPGRIVGRSEALPCIVRGIAVSDGYGYVVGSQLTPDGPAFGLRVIDVHDPSHPRSVGEVPPRWPFGVGGPRVVTSGRFVYVAPYGFGSSEGLGLRIVDARDPTQPTEVGAFEATQFVGSVALAGNLLTVPVSADPTSCSTSLRVLDLSDPAAPREVGKLAMPVCVHDLAALAAQVLVTSNRGIHVIDLAHPAKPAEVGFLTLSQDYGGADRIVVAAPRAYAISADFPANQIAVIDLSNPSRPREVGRRVGIGERDANGMAISANQLFVSTSPSDMSGPGGLQVYDLKDPTAPTLADQTLPLASAQAIGLSAGAVTVADWYGGVWGLDLTYPAAPAVGRSLPLTGLVWDVAVAGSYAYVAQVNVRTTTCTLGVLQLDQDGPVQQVGSAGLTCPRTPGSMNIALAGGIAYVTGGGGRYFWVVDITNAARPRQVVALTAPGDVTDLIVVGTYLYVSMYDYASDDPLGLWILDVRNPAAPQDLGVVPFPFDAGGMAAIGSHLFVGAGEDGLQVLDLTTPAVPKQVGEFSGGKIDRVAVVGQRLYAVGTRPDPVTPGYESPTAWVLDATNPVSPVEVGRQTIPDSANVMVRGELVLLAAWGYGVLVYQMRDVPTTATPSPVGSATPVATAMPTVAPDERHRIYLPAGYRPG